MAFCQEWPAQTSQVSYNNPEQSQYHHGLQNTQTAYLYGPARVPMILLTNRFTLNYFAGKDGCFHIMENFLVLDIM
jgi:hypothetical protein